MLNGLDLFSGIGGLSLALSPWVRPLAYCENERYAQAVLLSRMRRGELPPAPVWDDVTTLVRKLLPRQEIDIIYGGFPCQDISTAGDGAGLDGKRSGLVFELLRLVRDCQPRLVFLENVPALAIRGLDRVLLDLNALGYDARWTIVSAAEVGAPHLRERIWVLAHANGESLRLSKSGERRKKIHAPAALADGKDTHTHSQRVPFGGYQIRNEPKQPFGLGLLEGDDWDQYASFFHRVDHGVPNRSHRIRGIGNAVVPQAAREAFMRLSGLKMRGLSGLGFHRRIEQ